MTYFEGVEAVALVPKLDAGIGVCMGGVVGNAVAKVKARTKAKVEARAKAKVNAKTRQADTHSAYRACILGVVEFRLHCASGERQ
jgi:hypothetical protein